MSTLSVVIPVYNEEGTVAELLRRVLAVALPAGWGKEIVVVDDGSTDGTREALREWETAQAIKGSARVIYRAHNGGKGSAVKDGLAAATGDYVLIQDADLEYDPADIPALLGALGPHTQVVFGSRNLSPATRRGGLVPRLGVWVLTQEINWLWGLALTDVWTCYKVFPAAAKGDFVAGGFESELLHIAALARRGYTFAEVPISYNPRDAAHGKKIRYRDGLRAIIVLMADKIRHG